MVKSMALVCAALASLSASSFTNHMAGCLIGTFHSTTETQQIWRTDPMNSEAAMRYRTCQQQLSWRQTFAVR
jgi:hypothetical protein